MAKKSLREVDVEGKRVFVRADFNVPLEGGRITDDTRIRAALPTLQYLLDHGAAVIVASHLGRPKGQRVEGLSLQPLASRLQELLGRPVRLAPAVVGPEVRAMIQDVHPGDVLLLENLRFEGGEEANDDELARLLASYAHVYVNDAFGAAHRAHASTVGITRYLPSVAGFLMEREIEALGHVLQNPARPLAVVVGGAKISTKMAALQNLLSVGDEFFIGGGMANTLLKVRGYDVGASLVEDDQLDTAGAFLRQAQETGKRVHVPVDVVVAAAVDQSAEHKVVDVDAIPSGWSIVDIGPKTVDEYAAALMNAGSVVWNGPMGVFEMAPYAEGTNAIARALAAGNAWTVVGGGDSVAAVERSGVADRFDHISTGGGASLEFLEGRGLPGVEALQDREPGETHD